MKYDLGFGDSFAVREVLFKQLGGTQALHYMVDKEVFGYAKIDGTEKLVNQTRAVIKNFCGQKYKNVIITTGATGAIHAALGYLIDTVVNPQIIYDDYYFFEYPNICRMHDPDAISARHSHLVSTNKIRLTASPSNPFGEVGLFLEEPFVVWDAAYHSPAFVNKKQNIPNHDFMIGSFGKSFGLNGLRLGWIAFNDDVKELVEKKLHTLTLGPSSSSLLVMEQVLDKLDLESFTKESRQTINNNREIMLALESYTGQAVPENGMFYTFQSDSHIRSLLDKAGVIWTPGSICGITEGEWVRLSLGQTNKITKKAIDSVLKIDKMSN